LKNFFNPGPFARSMAVAALSRLGACWRIRVRLITLVLIASLCANCVGQQSAVQPKRDALGGLGLKSQTTLAIAGMTITLSAIGVGVYAIIQHAHTVKGCVSDSPDGLLLHTEDGKTFVLLGNTTNIKADTRIKVRGTKKKKINGITDQPSFVVEKLGKVYGPCSVPPATP
jgi:hypothetical protein